MNEPEGCGLDNQPAHGPARVISQGGEPGDLPDRLRQPRRLLASKAHCKHAGKRCVFVETPSRAALQRALDG